MPQLRLRASVVGRALDMAASGPVVLSASFADLLCPGPIDTAAVLALVPFAHSQEDLTSTD